MQRAALTALIFLAPQGAPQASFIGTRSTDVSSGVAQVNWHKRMKKKRAGAPTVPPSDLGSDEVPSGAYYDGPR